MENIRERRKERGKEEEKRIDKLWISNLFFSFIFVITLIALFVLFALGIFAFSRFNVRIYLSSFKCKSVWGFQTMRTYYLRKRIHEFCTRSMQFLHQYVCCLLLFLWLFYTKENSVFCIQRLMQLYPIYVKYLNWIFIIGKKIIFFVSSSFRKNI